MFVDASALVSILVEEDDADLLAAALESAEGRFTSPVAVYETVIAVNRIHAGGLSLAQSRVRALLDRADIADRVIEGQTASIALDAHARYGKGSGHPARLNLGDCFAYAMAKQHGAPLLYKGTDFALTDLA